MLVLVLYFCNSFACTLLAIKQLHLAYAQACPDAGAYKYYAYACASFMLVLVTPVAISQLHLLCSLFDAWPRPVFCNAASLNATLS